MPSSSDDDEQPVFDEAFIAGGIKESSLRRHQRALPPTTVSRPRSGTNALGNVAGPRDWTPAAGPLTRRRRRGHLVLTLAVLVAFGLGTWAWLSHKPGGERPPITALPIAASPSSTPSGEYVVGLTPDTEPGTCFVLTRAGAGRRATTVNCARAHTDQLVRLERASGEDAHYPTDAYWSGPVAKRCEQDVQRWTGLSSARWPRGFGSSSFIPRPQDWANGDRDVHCVAEWTPAGTGSARHLHPGAGSGSIPSGTAANGATTARTITGTLRALRSGTHACVVIRHDGHDTALVPSSSRYETGYSLRDGVIDAARTGVFAGTPGAGDPPVHALGAHVTVTGTYDAADTTAGCGLRGVFAFTAVR